MVEDIQSDLIEDEKLEEVVEDIKVVEMILEDGKKI